jgi:transcriptional regulator with XRE-family HTH domain
MNYKSHFVRVKTEMNITGRQVAAARELLKITRAELAEAAEVGLSSVYRFEEDLKEPRKATQNAIRLALEARGIVFTNGDNPGVTLDRSKATIRG